ncbi:MAG: PPE domain-containing protein, partial [Thermocrispum sp.]
MSQKAERREARERRRRRRTRRRENNRLLERFGVINWDVYEHRMMWNMIKSARPSEMGTKAYQWADLGAKADSATEEVRKTAQRLLMSWRGQSAVAAAGSISELTRWGARASGTARTVGDRLDTYTSAVQEARRRMPEPVHPTAERWFEEGRDVSVLDGPNGSYMLEQLLDDHEPSRRQQQRRKQEAVEVMQSY